MLFFGNDEQALGILALRNLEHQGQQHEEGGIHFWKQQEYLVALGEIWMVAEHPAFSAGAFEEKAPLPGGWAQAQGEIAYLVGEQGVFFQSFLACIPKIYLIR